MRRTRALLTILALSAITIITPDNAQAMRGGAIGKAIAEQLGLLAANIPENLGLNIPIRATVVSPEKLAKQGLTNIKEGQEVTVTLLDGNRISVVPVVAKATTTTTLKTATTATIGTTATTSTTSLQSSSLLLSYDAKGTITTRQLVPLQLDGSLKTVSPIIRQ